jgi:hypothetical protein
MKKIHAKAWIFFIQNKSDVKQEVHHIAIFNNVIFPSARILPASSRLVHPALNKLSVSDFSRDELHRKISRIQGADHPQRI